MEDTLKFTWDTRGNGGGNTINTVFTSYDVLSTRVDRIMNYCVQDLKIPAFIFSYDADEEVWEFEKENVFSHVKHNSNIGNFIP